MKNFSVKFKGNTKNFCRIARTSFEEILKKPKEILMKSCKLGIYIKMIEQLCKILIQLVDRGNSEEFQKKILRKLLCKFRKNYKLFLKKFNKIATF